MGKAREQSTFAVQEASLSHPDAAEGVASFLERRLPRFAAPLGDGPVAGVPRWPDPPPDVT